VILPLVPLKAPVDQADGTGMLEYVLDSPALLASMIAGLAVANYAVSLWSVREYSHQRFLELDWRPTGVFRRVRSEAARFALPLIGTAVVVVLTFLADTRTREVLVGGVLVMEMAMLGSNTADLLSILALQPQGAAEGRLRYSAAYRWRAGAARLVGMGIVTGVTSALFCSWPFLTRTVFLLGTAVGWLRRAAQASSMPN